jgi:predicted nucleic acid-binding protein
VIVISDTSPIHYLCLIGRIDILPAIFGSVVVPNAVAAELSRKATPQAARDFIGNPPGWLCIRAPSRPIAATGDFGDGELQAIALALELHADYLIIDDWSARTIAEQQQIAVIGTLGVLKIASRRGLVNLEQAINDLLLCGFYISDKLRDEMLGNVPGDSPN